MTHDKQLVLVCPPEASKTIAGFLWRHGMIPGIATGRGITVSREHLAAIEKHGNQAECAWDGWMIRVNGEPFPVVSAAEADAIRDAISCCRAAAQ